MAISTKAPLADKYIPIRDRYLELLGNVNRTTSSNLNEVVGGQNFTITDNTGETGLLNKLGIFLKPYNIEASDYNEIANTLNGNVQSISNLENELINLSEKNTVMNGSGEYEEKANLSYVETELAEIPTFQTAGGTATAITLTGINLTNGFSKTFIATANNNGSATTINGKSLYKPVTTTAPTLISGKAYTIWYNLASNCFFIKASAEGSADVANVLAGKTFSNDNDTGLVGTIPNYENKENTGYIEAKGFKADGLGSLTIEPLTGYYREGRNSSNYGSMILTDLNFRADNIKEGTSIFGVVGALESFKFIAGDTIIAMNDLYMTTSSTSYTKIKEIKVLADGVVRVKYGISSYSSDTNAYAKIYINGIAIGSERSTKSTTTVFFIEDYTVVKNDLIQLYCRVPSGSDGETDVTLFSVGIGNILAQYI